MTGQQSFPLPDPPSTQMVRARYPIPGPRPAAYLTEDMEFTLQEDACTYLCVSIGRGGYANLMYVSCATDQGSDMRVELDPRDIVYVHG